MSTDLTWTGSHSQRWVMACPVRWLLKYGLGLRSKAVARPLRLGALIHTGLDAIWGADTALSGQQVVFSRLSLMRGIRAVDAEVQRIVADLEVNAAQFDPDAGNRVDQRQDEDEVRAIRDEAEDILTRYVEHWQDRRKGWTLLANEATITLPTITLTGEPSPVTRWTMRLDKLVADEEGNAWLVEHKGTGLPLVDWRTANGYTGQAETYAALVVRHEETRALLERHGLGRPRGIVYDLLYTGTCRTAEQIGRLKKGGVAKSGGTPSTTSRRFLEAISAEGQTIEDVDWYGDTLEALRRREREGHWFRQELVEATDAELDRAEREMYLHGTEMRRLWRWAAPYREAVNNAPSREHVAAAVAAALRDIEHPRNHAECSKWGRICDYREPCQFADVASCHTFRVRGRTEIETEEDEDE